jgi:ASC-1-like (ASCH) protein
MSVLRTHHLLYNHCNDLCFLSLRKGRRFFSDSGSRLYSEKLQEVILESRYLQLIKNGQKTVEGRLNKNQYIQLKPGDLIKFKDTSDFQDTIFCRVESRTLYKNFKEMLENEGLKNCLPGVNNLEEGIKTYQSFPNFKEDAKKYQVVAFRISYLANFTFGDGL